MPERWLTCTGMGETAIGHGAVAKLPLPIVAPSPNRSVFLQDNGVAFPR